MKTKTIKMPGLFATVEEITKAETEKAYLENEGYTLNSQTVNVSTHTKD